MSIPEIIALFIATWYIITTIARAIGDQQWAYPRPLVILASAQTTPLTKSGRPNIRKTSLTPIASPRNVRLELPIPTTEVRLAIGFHLRDYSS